MTQSGDVPGQMKLFEQPKPTRWPDGGNIRMGALKPGAALARRQHRIGTAQVKDGDA